MSQQFSLDDMTNLLITMKILGMHHLETGTQVFKEEYGS